MDDWAFFHSAYDSDGNKLEFESETKGTEISNGAVKVFELSQIVKTPNQWEEYIKDKQYIEIKMF